LAGPAESRESSGSVEAFGAAGAVFMNGNPSFIGKSRLRRFFG
jgi:hypothetical protein